MLYLGIIGYPISHSISPRIHNAVIEELKIEGRYLAFEVKPADLKEAIYGAKALGFVGLNVTIPYKEEVLKFVKPIGEAKLAINTIDLRKMEGYNTDVYGVEMAFKNAEIDVKNKIALVIGAGGAGKAIALALMKMGARVILTNRTETRGIEAVKALREFGHCIFCPWEKIKELKINILANATPIGMKGFSSALPIPEEILKHEIVVFDAVYNPLETQLIKKAKDKGCIIINGLEMLVYQAEKAFEIWTGIKPPISLMKKVAIEALKVQ
ncbi:MAG: shikimate dehydrogenase [Archaeoglobaceae archaeon]|nr:shikimate dehydrogenase [Archaeoglobaceae archaeon]MDW8118346.1 shikimate dehydrogenase [Archaeoglobaceae archaeon]